TYNKPKCHPALSPRSGASTAITPARSVASESGVSDAQSDKFKLPATPAPKLPSSWSAVASKGLHIPPKPVPCRPLQAPKSKEDVKEAEESTSDGEWSVETTKKKEKEPIKRPAGKQREEEVPMFVTSSATATIPVPVKK